MTTLQLETWHQFYEDAPALWNEIWDELKGALKEAPGQERIDPDVGMYQVLDVLGRLVVVTVRDGEKLVGYTTTILQRHPHFPTEIAFGDSIYLAQEYRKGSLGLRLLRETERRLREFGVKRYFMPFYERAGMEKLYSRLGFSNDYQVYSKWIGD